jgi:hypothetical protein
MSEQPVSMVPRVNAEAAPLASLSRRPRPPARQTLPEPVAAPDVSDEAALVDWTAVQVPEDEGVRVPPAAAPATRPRRRPARGAAAPVEEPVAEMPVGVGAFEEDADPLRYLQSIKDRYRDEAAPNKNVQLPTSLAATLRQYASGNGGYERYVIAAALTEFFEKRHITIEGDHRRLR